MKLFLLLATLVAVASAMKSYSGHQVWTLTLNEKNDAHHLQSLVDHFDLDLMGEKRGQVDVRIPPEINSDMKKFLKMLKIQYTVAIQDLETEIQKEREQILSRATGERAFAPNKYNTWEDIEVFMADVAATTDYATLESIGTTYEGRDMWQIAFSKGAGRPVVWVDCGIHAREWISPATCLYGIDLLRSGYGTNADVTTLLDKYDVYILPVNNPDGYSYTWTNDRLFRKNRNDGGGAWNCTGVDLNRNFDDHFGGAGTSDRHCAATYRGPSAASEFETFSVQTKMQDLQSSNGIITMYSIHSYSQMWMWSPGWEEGVTADNDELEAVGKAGVDALTAVHGTAYTRGPIATTIYPAASTTCDYAYYQVGILYSYTLELRDTGFYGFELPEDQITPTAEETWTGLFAAFMAIP